MNIVVIGGAGFIGSHLVDRLLAEDHRVDVVDDLSTGSFANLAMARSVGGDLKIHHLDVTSGEASTLIGMRRPDVIFHLAAFPRSAPSSQQMVQSFAGALNLLDAARRHGVGRIVVALPATALYGQPAANSLPVKEIDPTPRGTRGVVARAIIDLLAMYREQEMVDFAALAVSSVYGPRQRSDGGVVAAFVEAAARGVAPVFQGDGRQTRDFVHVDDVVDALVRATERSSGLVINIGTGQQTAIRDLWSAVARDRADGGSGLEPEIQPQRRDELFRFAVSPVRARIHLGWSPWTDLATGLDRLRSGD